MIPASRLATDVPASTAILVCRSRFHWVFADAPACMPSRDLDLDPARVTEFPGAQEIWLAGEL